MTYLVLALLGSAIYIALYGIRPALFWSVACVVWMADSPFSSPEWCAGLLFLIGVLLYDLQAESI